MSESHHTHRTRRTSALAVDQVMVGERTAVLSLEGDLDLWSAPHLKSVLSELVAAGRTRLVLDLGRVAFMDSTGLGVLVGVQHRFGLQDHVAIAAAAPSVLRVFELSGLAGSLRVFASREAALSYVNRDETRVGDCGTPPLTADAALMLGIASTAMPFAQSSEEQAERWLRALRNHGEAGAVLGSLGLSEAATDDYDPEAERPPTSPGDPDAVATVTGHAGRIARERRAPKLATTDVLLAVIRVYGPTFYRVLSAHGVDPAELRARMASSHQAAAER